MITAYCPECKHEIHFNQTPQIGHILICVNCQKVLEVTWLFPLSIDLKERTQNISTKQEKDTG